VLAGPSALFCRSAPCARPPRRDVSLRRMVAHRVRSYSRSAALGSGSGSGSWLLALGSWLLALGSWLLALGSWLLALGSWLLALRGPRMTRRVGGGKPAGWPAGMRASFSPGQDALSKNPGAHPRTWRAKPGRRVIRGALLFGYFLLGKQEKVTRAAAAARKPAAGEPDRRIATTKHRGSG